MEELVKRIDHDLYSHLEREHLMFISEGSGKDQCAGKSLVSSLAAFFEPVAPAFA